jgi:hypothetical protein
MGPLYWTVLIASPGIGSRGSSPGVIGASKQQDLAARMKGLKTFLETRGAGLAHTGEFLAYYALPFVPALDRHPSFEHLFQTE